MLLQDFTQLVTLAEQHCPAAGDGGSDQQQQQQQQGGKAEAAAVNAARQVQITADTRQ
jgi:hypothetical protein